jgi:hypothetical protein
MHFLKSKRTILHNNKKCMTFYQFKALSEYKQYQYIKSKGVIIANRISAAYKFLLYQIDSFYVELKYNLLETKIEVIRCFSGTKDLDPYLGDISLPEL